MPGFGLCFVLASLVARGVGRRITGLRKTVTFGDESAVMANRLASVVSVMVVFLLWAAFTGSKLLPGLLHVLGPFIGDAVFTYTLETPGGGCDEAQVTVMVRSADRRHVRTPFGDPAAQPDLVLFGAPEVPLAAKDNAASTLSGDPAPGNSQG